MAENSDIIAVKGDSTRWSYFFGSLTGGSTFNFGGCTLFMQVRKGYYDEPLIAGYTQYIQTNNTLSYPKGVTGGISAAGTGGTVYFCIGSSFANNYTTDRMCKYDVKVQHPALEDIQTILRGNLQVLPNVSQIR
jgi:hypothetical protein